MTRFSFPFTKPEEDAILHKLFVRFGQTVSDLCSSDWWCVYAPNYHERNSSTNTPLFKLL